MPRMIFHNLPSRVSVGVDVNDATGYVVVALAATHPRDEAQRRHANEILNGRLDSKRVTDLCDSLGIYKGKSVGKDVYAPVRDVIRNLSNRRNVSSILSDVRGALGDNVSELDVHDLFTTKFACNGGACSV